MGGARRSPEEGESIITNEDVLRYFNGAAAILNDDTPFKAATALSLIQMALEKRAEYVKDGERRLMREYAKVKDGKKLYANGRAVIDPEREEEFEEKKKAFFAETFTVRLPKVKLSWFSPEDEGRGINPRAMALLGDLLERDIDILK